MNRRTIGFVLVPIMAFMLLAFCVQTGMSFQFEDWAYGKATETMSSSATWMMKNITNVGDKITLIVFCLILIIVPKTRKTIAFPISAALLSSALLNVALKTVFSRSRPDILQLVSETGHSFPSGHAMSTAALATIAVLLIWKYMKSTPLKIILSTLCVIVTVFIGFSRVYLGVHYAGDILGGWLLGFAVSMLVYFLWNARQLKKAVDNKEQPDRHLA